jgi:hypothetical protein
MKFGLVLLLLLLLRSDCGRLVGLCDGHLHFAQSAILMARTKMEMSRMKVASMRRMVTPVGEIVIGCGLTLK